MMSRKIAWASLALFLGGAMISISAPAMASCEPLDCGHSRKVNKAKACAATRAIGLYQVTRIAEKDALPRCPTSCGFCSDC